MASIAFVLLDYLPSQGSGILANWVRHHGHTASVLFARERRFAHELVSFAPDFLGLYLPSGSLPSAFNLIGWAKMILPAIKVVAGGPHPTFVPEMAGRDGVDFVVRGEAENGLIALLAAAPKTPEDLTGIPNLAWRNEQRQLHQEALAPPLANLDELPFADWEPFFRRPWLSAFYRGAFTMVTSRGCPNQCSYCQNQSLRRLYRGFSLLRRRSLDHVGGEIAEAKARYGIYRLRFDDDDFCLDPSFLTGFAERNAGEGGLPFACNTNAATVDEEAIARLSKARCKLVILGLECGDPLVRSEILNRRIDNEKILATARLFKKYGMHVELTNMFGMPGETLESTMATWRMNRQIGPRFVFCSLITPYPGTALYEEMLQKGQIPRGEAPYPASYFQDSSLDLRQQPWTLAMQKLLQAFLWLRLPEAAVRRVVRLRVTALHHLIFWLTYYIGQVRSKKLKIGRSLLFAWRNRPQVWRPPR